MPDQLIAWLCLPLAVYILMSGVDDLWLDLHWIARRFGGRKPPPAPPVSGPVAIWVACWRESDVIEQMLSHNRSAIADADFDFFVGVYPNDPETVEAAKRAVRNDARVHVAEVPHEGPTSKADCLNWIYQRMLLAENESGRHYTLVVIHDAEDLIHPRSLDRIRTAAGAGYDMIQVPVLALQTPLHELTHGLYCDDFAESQTKDLISRVEIGGFLPGCGVGTAFRREVLDRLAEADDNRLFDPSSLTEDYDNGLRLFRLGARQYFLPLEKECDAPVATREFFPRDFVAAVRQRSRWITGNSLQAWERYGWGAGMPGKWTQRYFLWRDRKALWGAPLGLLANLMLCHAWWAKWTSADWSWGVRITSMRALTPLLWLNGALLLERLVVRIVVVAKIYGLTFALLSPLRTLWGNGLNSAACALALFTWTRCRLLGLPLRWVKTEHAYPNREALANHRRNLGEILVSHGYCAQEIVDHAIEFKGSAGLGDYLVDNGLLSDHELCHAMSLQQALPIMRLDAAQLRPDVVRSLPRKLQHDHELMPVSVCGGELNIASAQAPSAGLCQELRRYTALTIRFWLVPRSEISKARATLQSRS